MESITIYVVWYERNSDFTPNYSKELHGTISGATPSEVMTKYRQFQSTHDLSKYTRTEIQYIW